MQIKKLLYQDKINSIWIINNCEETKDFFKQNNIKLETYNDEGQEYLKKLNILEKFEHTYNQTYLNNYFENSKLYFQNWTKKEIYDKKDYITEKKKKNVLAVDEADNDEAKPNFKRYKKLKEEE